MKKVLIALGVIVVLIGGGLWYVVANIDMLVKNLIETAGTDAVGSEVRVEEVRLDLRQGQATILGFTVANPQGFSDADMLRFDELSVALDLGSFDQDMLRINSIVARNPFVLYEMVGRSSNLEAVSARFASDEPAPEPAGEAQPIAIGSIDIEGIRSTLASDMLTQDVQVTLGDIHLRDLEGTPTEIATQVMRPLVNQLSNRASEALLGALAEYGREDIDAAVEDLRGEAEQRLEDEVGNFLRR